MDAVSPADIAVVVFTSALNLHERALSVQSTWLRDFPKGYLVGGRCVDPDLKMISLGAGVGEDYRSAHEKQFLGLLELYHRFPEAKWFYITGCDAFVFSHNLAELLSRYDQHREYFIGGHCGEAMVDGAPLIYPSGGPGFALSQALVASIAPVIPGYIEEWKTTQVGLRSACDVALAYLVWRERGVKVSFVDGFYNCPPYRYPGNPYRDGEGREVDRGIIDAPIAFHALSIREMYLLSSGRMPRKPTVLSKGYDLLSVLLSRKLRSRAIVNRLSQTLFG